MSHTDSILGLPAGYLERDRADSLRENLAAVWSASMLQPMTDLHGDLVKLRKWFDPVAQGQRLRRDLAALPQLPETIVDPGPPLTFFISDSQGLITPEGRCAFEFLSTLPRDRPGYILSDEDLFPYDRILARVYRDWSRHRITSVVDLLRGEEKPLQLAAAGVVLALLVNRSTSESRALKRFSAGAARDVIDDAFFSAVNAFTGALSPKQRTTRDPRLISGWMLYEARRRLGDDVLIIEGSRPETDGRLWVDEIKQDEVLDMLARDLGRGHRAKVTTETLSEAFDALVFAFRSQIPRLAGYGLAHERPANTLRIRNALIERFDRYADLS